MNPDFQFPYSIESGIVIQYFKGPVTMDIIIDAWDNLFRENVVRPGLKGVISGYTEANLEVNMKDLMTLKQFFLSNSKLIKSLRLAQVIDSPKIVLPQLFESENPEFKTKAFSTIAAAKKWILDPWL